MFPPPRASSLGQKRDEREDITRLHNSSSSTPISRQTSPPSAPTSPAPSHSPSNRVIKAFRARPASQVGFMLPFRTLEFTNLTAGLGERFKYFSQPYLPVWASGGSAKRSIWRYIWSLTFDRFIGRRREGRGCLSLYHCFPGMTYYLYAPFQAPPSPSWVK